MNFMNIDAEKGIFYLGA